MAWTCPETIRFIRFSPSGLLLATTGHGADGDYVYFHRLWDALSGRELASLREEDVVHAAVFASERSLLICGERGARLWDTTTGETRQVLSDFCSAAMASTGRKPFAVVWESGLTAIDLPSGSIRHRLHTPGASAVYGDEMDIAGRHLAACCRAQDEYHNQQVRVALWDLERGKLRRTYDVDVGRHRWDDWPLLTVAVHPKGKLLAVGTMAVRSFGLDWEEELEGFKPFDCGGDVHNLRYSPDGAALWALAASGFYRLSPRTGAVIARFRPPSSFRWKRGAIDPSGEKVALAADREVEVLDVLDA